MLDHLEYDSESLAEEYFRDVKAKVPDPAAVQLLPRQRSVADATQPLAAHAHLLLSNWINEIYQTTPFDISRIGEA